MVLINGMFILDYPDRIISEPITEEGQKRIREGIEMLNEFMKDNPVTLVNADGVEFLK